MHKHPSADVRGGDQSPGRRRRVPVTSSGHAASWLWRWARRLGEISMNLHRLDPSSESHRCLSEAEVGRLVRLIYGLCISRGTRGENGYLLLAGDELADNLGEVLGTSANVLVGLVARANQLPEECCRLRETAENSPRPGTWRAGARPRWGSASRQPQRRSRHRRRIHRGRRSGR